MKFIFKSIILIYSSLLVSQEIPNCLKEDLINHKLMISGFHATMVKTNIGIEIFGQLTAPNGTSNLLKPTNITKDEGFNYEGKLLDFTLGDGGNAGTTVQFIVLSTEGLYIWGKEDTVIPSDLTSSSNFQSFKMPNGITPNNVKSIEASLKVLVLLTKSGDVYVLSSNSSLYGDGSSVSNSDWHKANISNVKFISVASEVIFVYTNGGEYYTWGSNTFLGDSNPPNSKNIPTKMINPGFTGEPKMIVAGSGGSYFVLGTNKRVYSLGINGVGQLGVGNNTDQLQWKNVVNENNTGPMENVIFINTTNNAPNLLASGLITNDLTLYLWGSNSASMIGSPNNTDETKPTIPKGFIIGTNQAIYVENGGHVTPYVDFKLKKYGYIGHKTGGSMGDGSGSEIIPEYNLDDTPEIEFCFMTVTEEIDTNCDQKTVIFKIDTKDVTGDYIVTWDFGDESPIITSKNETETHTYSNYGKYKATAKLIESSGFERLTEFTLTIKDSPNPIINFNLL